MNLIYYAHSYREVDATVVKFFMGLMRDEGLTPSLDPPSDRLNSAKPERHLRATDGMIAVLTAREGGVSQYIMYEVSLCLRTFKPLLVFIEDTLPEGLIPPRVLQRRFSRKGLLRQIREHRHAIQIMNTYVGEKPPPTYQPALEKRSCIIVGGAELGPPRVASLQKLLAKEGYLPRILEVKGDQSAINNQAAQEAITTADLAICLVDTVNPQSHFFLGAFRTLPVPAILLTAHSDYAFHSQIPLEYQPRRIDLMNALNFQKVISEEIDIFEEEYVDLADQSEVARYSELLIRESSPVGQYSRESRGVFIEELVMGDQYNVKGQAAAVGKGAVAKNINFNQVWNEQHGDLSLRELADDLARLRQELRSRATAPEHDIAISQVAQAEQQSKAENGPGVLKHLSKAGSWVLDVAKEVSAKVATEALKSALGV